MSKYAYGFQRYAVQWVVYIVGRRNFAHLFFSFQVHIKHGTSFKWKSRCKVEREGQKWTDNEVSAKNNADLYTNNL